MAQSCGNIGGYPPRQGASVALVTVGAEAIATVAQQVAPLTVGVVAGMAIDGAVAGQGVARLHDVGDLLPKDPETARQWYQRAAAQGHAGGQLQMGMSYAAGIMGLERDRIEAARWLSLASRQEGRYGQAARDLLTQRF